MGCVFISEKCIWNAEIPLQRRNKMPKTFSFDVVSSSRKSCKDAHFEHINKHHIIRTPCMAVHVQQKRATIHIYIYGRYLTWTRDSETECIQRMSVVIVWMQSQVKTFWNPFGCQVLRFTSKGKTHCARIHSFVHAIAYRALCTHSGLCARNQGFVHAVYAK